MNFQASTGFCRNPSQGSGLRSTSSWAVIQAPSSD